MCSRDGPGEGGWTAGLAASHKPKFHELTSISTWSSFPEQQWDEWAEPSLIHALPSCQEWSSWCFHSSHFSWRCQAAHRTFCSQFHGHSCNCCSARAAHLGLESAKNLWACTWNTQMQGQLRTSPLCPEISINPKIFRVINFSRTLIIISAQETAKVEPTDLMDKDLVLISSFLNFISLELSQARLEKSGIEEDVPAHGRAGTGMSFKVPLQPKPLWDFKTFWFYFSSTQTSYVFL